MEERDNILPMHQNKMQEKTQKKLTYEELENACHQLSEQARKMYMQLQEANQFNFFKRLDYLFKVLENATMFSAEFVTKCSAEVEETMALPTGEDKDGETENTESPTEEVTSK